ncbi:unnamed protein product [Arabidopsis halleri]
MQNFNQALPILPCSYTTQNIFTLMHHDTSFIIHSFIKYRKMFSKKFLIDLRLKKIPKLYVYESILYTCF